jgi:hypothetical protein
MTPAKLVWPGEVATALTKVGCNKIAGTADTFDVWMTDYGFTFVVPALGPDRLCPHSALMNILTEIEAKRPKS